MLVTGQKDFPGVHAAQLAHVDRHRRRHAVPGDRSGRERVVVDAVRTGNDMQAVRVDRGVDPHGSGDQVHLIHVRRIEPRALHGDVAARDVVAGERAAGVEKRHARRQDGARRIDESAAIDGNSGRIREHDRRPLTRDLEKAVELRGVGAVDLVDDDPRRLARCIVRIAVDLTAELRAGDRRRIVENGAALLDVELRIGVHRHAGAAGPVDVHLRQAIRAADDAGRMCARRHDLRERRQRCPAQQQRGRRHGGFAASPFAACRRALFDRDEHVAHSAEHQSVVLVHLRPTLHSVGRFWPDAYLNTRQKLSK